MKTAIVLYWAGILAIASSTSNMNNAVWVIGIGLIIHAICQLMEKLGERDRDRKASDRSEGSSVSSD